MVKMWIVLMVVGQVRAVDAVPPYVKTEAACQSLARLMSIDLAAEMGDTSENPVVRVECVVSDTKPQIAQDDDEMPGNDPSMNPEDGEDE